MRSCAPNNSRFHPDDRFSINDAGESLPRAGIDYQLSTTVVLERRAVYGFITTAHGNRFSVVLQSTGLESRSVVFEQTEVGVVVKDGDDNEVLEATLTLNNQGECRLKVGKEELEFWQFRRLVLEDFFFNPPSAVRVLGDKG
jgi:hypothetical protein